MAAAAPRLQIGFFADSHLYTLDGSEVPSVTQVLDAEGLTSYEFCEDYHRRRGSNVHRIAQLLASSLIRGNTVDEVIANSRWDPSDTTTNLVGYGRSAALYLLESRIRPELVERPVASARMRYAGTLDLFGITPEGIKLLVDFKSGSVQEGAWAQTALYCQGLEETLGIKADQRTIVRLQSDGKYKCYPPRPAGGTDLAIGQAAVTLYHWRKRHRLLG